MRERERCNKESEAQRKFAELKRIEKEKAKDTDELSDSDEEAKNGDLLTKPEYGKVKR